MPKTNAFFPAGTMHCDNCEDAIILTVDEFEAIRLIDHQGYSQLKCGDHMQVARTTVQMIYNSARKKLAAALVDGLPIRIEGGDYTLYGIDTEFRGCPACRKASGECTGECARSECACHHPER